MFDIHKDIDRYRGVPPYSIELYGVYIPFLGWQSRLTKSWLSSSGVVVNPRIKALLDANVAPLPTRINPDEDYSAGSGTVDPLGPGTVKSPYSIVLGAPLNSVLLALMIQPTIQAFVQASNGHLPVGDEWRTVFDREEDLRKTNDFARFLEFAKRGWPNIDVDLDAVKVAHLERMQYESEVARIFLMCVDEQTGLTTDVVKQLFLISKSEKLGDLFGEQDPLSEH